jgi:phosphatidyl-myo-inositol dimannoside synthase
LSDRRGGRPPKHLLVTNDFPPKIGGIQSYLWELWRRLPAEDVTVMTTSFPGDGGFDRAQPFRVVRTGHRVLLPTPALARRIDDLASEVGAELVVLDPVLPLGALGTWLRRPYGLIVHGAELSVPGHLPASGRLARRALRGACLVITSGEYARRQSEAVAGAALPGFSIPPGVDAGRFRPLAGRERDAVRRRWGFPETAPVVLGVGRLVPRKGFDILVEAAARLAPGRPDLSVVIAGTGRQAQWLARSAASRRAPVRMLGGVSQDQLPALYGAVDLFASPCRVRWGGLEQEGFGIVFLEAAAAGVPAVAGSSGGVAEAVLDGVTGMVVDRPRDPAAVTRALAALLDDPERRRNMGGAARRRAVEEFSYDHLSHRLADGLARAGP